MGGAALCRPLLSFHASEGDLGSHAGLGSVAGGSTAVTPDLCPQPRRPDSRVAAPGRESVQAEAQVLSYLRWIRSLLFKIALKMSHPMGSSDEAVTPRERERLNPLSGVGGWSLVFLTFILKGSSSLPPTAHLGCVGRQGR